MAVLSLCPFLTEWGEKNIQKQNARHFQVSNPEELNDEVQVLKDMIPFKNELFHSGASLNRNQ